MSLHPIRALDHVIDEYRDYLLTEFRAKDPDLKKALEDAIDEPLFLAQEAFYQAHRPFKPGKPWKDLPLNARLAKALEARSGSETSFVHQTSAIERLLGPKPGPLVVTTGTGSGKTEAFMVPVIQNAIADAVQFKRDGLTAILIYPMNALANDQRLRIDSYLKDSGFDGTVRVEQYDRATTQAKREEMRKNPPHILLTNYMMLEYLLVRPADRDAIFANHRCRFLVLDEVHTYRGTLGTNIALLVRRLKEHLKRSMQTWLPDPPADIRPLRCPNLIAVGTSATIKSVAEGTVPPAEARRLRDEAVQEFFHKLTGAPCQDISVFGEELQEIQTPAEASYPPLPAEISADLDVADPEAVRRALCALAGQPADCDLAAAARRYRLLWDMNRWLIKSPMSVTGVVARVKQEVPDRAATPEDRVRREVESALTVGAALPDGTPGALRLRVHRLIRGGWRFHRCVDPACGKLYPMGEDRCTCGHHTAPLFLCRNCGADYLRFVGNAEVDVLRPSADTKDGPESMLYVHERFESVELPDEFELEEEVERPRSRAKTARQPKKMRGREVLVGSFDPETLAFSADESSYSLHATLVPARNQCLCCGGSAGSRNVVTPVALGTSAAVKVLSEGMVEALADAHRGNVDGDSKERLLVFSDSRQDAAHQARFIIFASRYDRMRRRVLELLEHHGSVTLQKAVEALGDRGVREGDNEYAPEDPTAWLTDSALARIRCWEEAPLLDDIAVNAGYRGTLVNLGLMRVVYHRLDEYVAQRGVPIAGELGITTDQLEYIRRSLLDEMRVRGCLSRELLRYHPKNPSFPKDLAAANWERKVKQPKGYPLSEQGGIKTYLETVEVPVGITCRNAWRRDGAGGRSPSFEAILKHLLEAFGGAMPNKDSMASLLTFLCGPFLAKADLFGSREKRKLLQVNEEVVRLTTVAEAERFRCNVCGYVIAGAVQGLPCPKCHGHLTVWSDKEVNGNRSVRRLRNPDVVPLVAREHTAQVPREDRDQVENGFKARASDSRINLLACSPTLEMGIDVGGLDAVVLRNVPPRPDNYAQRGGRAGRRTRVGLVLGYARSTPHDQYFYDKPEEMIAGEVPAPALALGNRDVVLRHLNAIAFGAAEPGLAGKMVEYVLPDGTIKQDTVDELVNAIAAKATESVKLACSAWGDGILDAADLDGVALQGELDKMPAKVQRVVDLTSRQVKELRKAMEAFYTGLVGQQAANRSASLVRRLLGIEEREQTGKEADDRSAGYPLRRFAEFGILPGYEFPSEPASLRLLSDGHEEEPITVTRRLGLDQFRPDAQVYARTRRWKVTGLDTSSPWNPSAGTAPWQYRLCDKCGLRFRASAVACPRCDNAAPGLPLPAAEYGGFVAVPDEGPILDEEDRFAVRNLVRCYPQWNGETAGRWSLGDAWTLHLSKNEEVRWMNEGPEPGPNDDGPVLHGCAKGYLLCDTCGKVLKVPTADGDKSGQTRRKTHSKNQVVDDFGHSPNCINRSVSPKAVALVTNGQVEVLRLLVPVPGGLTAPEAGVWGLSLGYALMAGMRHEFMLDGPEVTFELEGPWQDPSEADAGRLSLTFIDPNLGGSGYLPRIAARFDAVARQALDHLDHKGCETACYRCLKSYWNQRFHENLRWPVTLEALEVLAHTQPEGLSAGYQDDPTPWLEAYAAGVDSPLELKFLRLFEKHGFAPEKQVPIRVPGAVDPITVADFAVPERRIAIYIDGLAFHRGVAVRRDAGIRKRLEDAEPPWTVVVLNAADLSRGGELVDCIRAL